MLLFDWSIFFGWTLMDRLIDWLLHGWMDGWTASLIDWLIDQVSCRFVSVDWLIDDWMIDWLINWFYFQSNGSVCRHWRISTARWTFHLVSWKPCERNVKSRHIWSFVGQSDRRWCGTCRREISRSSPKSSATVGTPCRKRRKCAGGASRTAFRRPWRPMGTYIAVHAGRGIFATKSFATWMPVSRLPRATRPLISWGISTSWASSCPTCPTASTWCPSRRAVRSRRAVWTPSWIRRWWWLDPRWDWWRKCPCCGITSIWTRWTIWRTVSGWLCRWCILSELSRSFHSSPAVVMWRACFFLFTSLLVLTKFTKLFYRTNFLFFDQFDWASVCRLLIFL